MNLVDDENLVGALLWLKTDLVGQIPDVFYRIVGGSIQLNDVKGLLFCKSLTGRALAACFTFRCAVQTVDGTGQDPGSGGLTYTARSAKQECMRQLILTNGILQRPYNVLLANHIGKPGWTIFSCGDYKGRHIFEVLFVQAAGKIRKYHQVHIANTGFVAPVPDINIINFVWLNHHQN